MKAVYIGYNDDEDVCTEEIEEMHGILTLGKIYDIDLVDGPYGSCKVFNDIGRICIFPIFWFKDLRLYREEKLNNLLDE